MFESLLRKQRLLTASLALLAVTSPAQGQTDRSAQDSAEQETIHYTIVVTGAELLQGAFPDAHTHFITRTLLPLGLDCVGSMIVNDKKTDLADALRFSSGKAPLVIVTGGLGPTDNDITREAIGEFTGIPLEEHPEVMKQMEQRFGRPFDQLRANLRRQARVPKPGTYLRNANGTAVGLVFEAEKEVIVALPGPPRELQPMLRDELVPYLSRRFRTRMHVSSLTLRFVGIGQSAIDQTLKDHVAVPEDMILSSQFEAGRVDFTFSLASDKPEDRSRLQDLENEVRKHLGDYLYASDGSSLEESVIKLLESRGISLALVEVGSGGSLASGLTGVGGARKVLVGAYVAPDEERMAKLLRVSPENWARAASELDRAKELAAAAGALTSSRWVVFVGETRRDPDGASNVQVVCRLPDDRWEIQRIARRGSADQAYLTLTTQILDFMRRLLK